MNTPNTIPFSASKGPATIPFAPASTPASPTPPTQSLGDKIWSGLAGIGNYAAGIANIPGAIANDITNVAPRGIINAVNKGGDIAGTGINQVASGDVVGGVGNIVGGYSSALAGGLGSLASGVFSPVGETLNAAIPKTGVPLIDSTISGGTAGAALAGPAGALPGAAVGLGFAAKKEIVDALLKNPDIAKFNSNHADFINTISNSVDALVAGLGISKLGQPSGNPNDVMNTNINDLGSVPGKIANNLSDTASAGMNAISSIAKPITNLATYVPKTLIGGIQDYVSRKNAPLDVPTSIDRLATIADSSPTTASGKSIEMNDPLSLYNKYYNQEQLHSTDVKADTPIASVGEDIGNQFDKVIQMRRDVGKTMGSEVSKIGKISTDVTNSFTNLEEELNNNGLNFNADTQKLVPTDSSKVTAQDRSLLDNYIVEINKLGATPTAQQLDAFISRIPKEIKVFKNTNNVTGVTNGERIIMGSLNDLTQNLSPESNPAFKDYYQARKEYAQLSDVVDTGSKLLGKPTLSGDYVKDASVAKRGVQSIADNGTKDFLLKLEDLTGYPALDRSALALQAMRDAGNPQGHSLLELTANQGIPTSPKGIIAKAGSVAIDYGKKLISGTPYDQTVNLIKQRTGK